MGSLSGIMAAIPNEFYMPKIKDMTDNGFNMEYFKGPVLSGQISYSFPVSKPVTATFTFTPIPQPDVESVRIYPIEEQDGDEFLLNGAL